MRPRAAARGTAPNTLGPQQLVEDSAKRMLTELDAHRAMYAKDPAKLDALVANVLLPNFDSEYAARLVLGQTWRTATPEQRKRFVDAFYHSLLRNYGNALLNFTADRFVVLPYRGDPERSQRQRAHRGQEVLGRESGGRISVCARPTRAGRRGTSSSRASPTSRASAPTLRSEIQQKGLDEVITRLEKEGTVSPNKPAPGSGS